MKKPIAFAFASAALALGAAFPQAATAQRVIEETLVLRDPTVAAPNRWLIGAALEYWYVSGDYNITDSTTGNTIAEGTIKYTQPGFNIYAGYGDFTVLYTSRSGDGDIDLNYAPAIGTNVLTNTKVEQEDREILLRWIFLKRQHFAPYAVVGYTWTEYEAVETILTSGFIWPGTGGSRTRRTKVEYQGPMAGIGAIIPINDRFGFRVDGRVKFLDAESTTNQFNSRVEDSGIGYDFTGTGYINIFQGLNLQAGGRFTHLDGGEAIGSTSRWGWFAMLGYTHRF